MFLKTILFTVILSLTYFSFGQTELIESKSDSTWYEIIKSSKRVEHFTTEGILNLENTLRDKQTSDTTYYNVSEWTMIKIYPKKD